MKREQTTPDVSIRLSIVPLSYSYTIEMKTLQENIRKSWHFFAFTLQDGTRKNEVVAQVSWGVFVVTLRQVLGI